MKRFLSVSLVIVGLGLFGCGSDDDGGGAGGSAGTAGSAGSSGSGGTGGVGGSGGGGTGGSIGGTGGTGGTGGAGGTGGGCQDTCTPSGGTQCSGAVVQTCNPGSDGCLAWANTTDCAALSPAQICDSSSGAAACAPSCTDQCTTSGATQCSGSVIQTCAAGSSGCLEWTSGTDCATTNQACDATGGTAQCVNTCTDQCTTSGATQCSGNVIQTCGTGASGCLEWATSTDCAATSQVCDATGGSAQCITPCTNQCAAAGNQSCSGTVIQTCTLGTNGCLDWVAGTDCASTSQICQQSGTTASCGTACTNQCATAGAKQCDGAVIEICAAQTNGCLDWQTDTTCTTGQTCQDSGSGPACVTAPPTGENCASAYPLQAGTNTVAWTATTNDYLTSNPSCLSSSFSITGPDVVLSYTAPADAIVDLSFAKPTSTRWVSVVSASACGTLTPELACITDFSPATMGGTFSVTGGTTYYIYAVDTSSGANPLSNPLVVTLTETPCSTIPAPVATTVTPTSGSTTASLSPTLQAVFDAAISKTQGTITLTGNISTNITYDLSTSPSQVTFTNTDKTININPGISLPPGEVITVTWSLFGAQCNKPVAAASWSFTIVTPPCTPGAGGMVGTTEGALATTITSITEYYIAPDENPAGYVYIGGTSSLWRTPKAGGTSENVYTAAGLTTSHTGYEMLIAGDQIFTVNESTTGTTGKLWRISSDGGASWNVQDFAVFPTAPADDFKAVAVHGGKIYLATEESSTTVPTEIWSVDLNPASLPATATLEGTTTERYINGIAVDNANYYLVGWDLDRVVRVDRTTMAITPLMNLPNISTTRNPLHKSDTNNDGTADFLYVKNWYEQIFFVCQPAGAAYADVLLSYGTASGAYGLGFSSTSNTLWAWNGSGTSFVTVQ